VAARVSTCSKRHEVALGASHFTGIGQPIGRCQSARRMNPGALMIAMGNARVSGFVAPTLCILIFVWPRLRSAAAAQDRYNACLGLVGFDDALLLTNDVCRRKPRYRRASGGLGLILTHSHELPNEPQTCDGLTSVGSSGSSGGWLMRTCLSVDHLQNRILDS
jgi:hypothetical protein